MEYEIRFLSQWHCGSGLAAGADVDSLVVKDKNNLPYVPGKTIKGLVREAAEDILQFRGTDKAKLADLFGNSKDRNNADGNMRTGSLFFSNAELVDKQAIINTDLSNGCNYFSNALYNTISSTAISDKGVAEKNSLRKIQVVVPCILKGRIENVPDEEKSFFKDCLRYIKRLGQSRNRGFGRCVITVKE